MQFKYVCGDFAKNTGMTKLGNKIIFVWGWGQANQLQINGLVSGVETLSSDGKGKQIVKCSFHDGRSITAEVDMDAYKTLLAATQQLPSPAGPSPARPAPAGHNKRAWMWGVGVLVLLVMGSLIGIDESTNPAAVKNAAVSANTLAESSVRALLDETLGDCNREGVSKIGTIEITDFDSGTKKLCVSIAADDNLTSSFIRGGACDDIKKVAEATYKHYPNMGYLEVIMTFCFKDKYGTVSESQYAVAGFTRGTLGKINFENLFGEDIIKAADYGSVYEGE